MTTTPGPNFQLGLQLGLCVLLTGLPTFVKQLNFPHACFTPVLTIICLVSMSADGHVGTKVQAACSLLGETWVGAGLAGIMVSIAKPLQLSHPSAYLAVLCVTSSLGLACLIAPRAGPRPLALWPHITVSTLIFSTVVLYGQLTWPVGQFWQHDVGGVCAAGAVAAGAVLLVSVLVLPSLAADQAVCLASAVITRSGHAVTRLLSLLLDPLPAVQPGCFASSQLHTAAHGRQAMSCHHHNLDSVPVAETDAGQCPAATQLRQQGRSILTNSQHQLPISKVEPSYMPQHHALLAPTTAEPQPAACLVKQDSARKAVTWRQDLVEVTPPMAAPATATIDAESCSKQQLQDSLPESFSEGADLAVVDPQMSGIHGEQSFVTVSTLTGGFTSNSSMLSRTGSASSDTSTADAGSSQRASNNMTVYFEQDTDQTNASLSPMLLQQHAAWHASHRPQVSRDNMRSGQSPAVFTSKLPPARHDAHTAVAADASTKLADEASVQQVPNGRSDRRPATHTSSARQVLTVLSLMHKKLWGHNLQRHHKEQSAHAAVLHTPSGPVAVLGPSVDQLRPLLVKARTCLQRTVLEPCWVGFPVRNHSAGLDIERWSSVLTAADRLLSMVSSLEDVLITASRRLIHPTLHPSTERFSDTATAAVCRVITCCSDVAAALSQPHDKVAALRISSGTDWQGAKAELARSSAAAMQEYWEFVYSRRHSELKVARSSEMLAVMFVWVMVGGLVEAAHQLQQTAAAAMAVGVQSVGLPGVLCDVGTANSRQQTQQLVERRLYAALELLLLLPVLSNCSALLQKLAASASGWFLNLSNLMLSLIQQNTLELPVSTMTVTVLEKSSDSKSRCLHSQSNRAVLAALKLWLAMSILLSMTLVTADPTAGHLVMPTISEAVRESPAAGVIAFVLAWHERVESTIIRVILRILGTAAGTSFAHGVLVNPIMAGSPALLMLVMMGAAMLLAPLADPSFHLRLTTALIMISACVTIVCQYDIVSGGATGSVAFFLTRIVEVVIACLWTALFNHLILPWSSTRWSIEGMAKSYSAAVTVIEQLCQVQFSRYAKPFTQTSMASAASKQGQGSNTEQRPPDIFGSGTSLLQSDVVAPLVAVQNELTLQVNIWRGWGPRQLVPRKVRRLMTSMLVLADRLMAMQVVVSSMNNDDAAEHNLRAADSADENTEQVTGAARSLEFISDTIMRPVHQCHAELLTLARATVEVLQQHVMEQGRQPGRQLQQIHGELKQQWHNSRTVFAAQRHTLHCAVREHQAISLSAGKVDYALGQPSVPSATAAPYESTDLSMRTLAGHMWWLHAAAHYQHQLAYQHAFDSVIKQLLDVLQLFSLC